MNVLNPTINGSILVMVAVTYLIRALPLTLIQKPIKSRFIRSLLYYTPYATLVVMTVPAIFTVASNPLIGIIALILGSIVAWKTESLPMTALTTSSAVLLISFFL